MAKQRMYISTFFLFYRKDGIIIGKCNRQSWSTNQYADSD